MVPQSHFSHTRTFITYVASDPKSMGPYGAIWTHFNQYFINFLTIQCAPSSCLRNSLLNRFQASNLKITKIKCLGPSQAKKDWPGLAPVYLGLAWARPTPRGIGSSSSHERGNRGIHRITKNHIRREAPAHNH